MAPAISRGCLHGSPIATAAFIAGLRYVPDLLEDLDPKALVIGIVACEVAVVLALGVGTRAAENEFLPVAHVGRNLNGDGRRGKYDARLGLMPVIYDEI